MNTLKLSFIYAFPLDRGRRAFFAEKGLDYPSISEINSTVTHLQELWDETDAKYNVISHLVELTGRNPERNLECFVYGTGLGAMSTPFLLPIWNKEGQSFSDEKFIDLLIHELLHIFIITNNKPYLEFVKKRFEQEEVVCQNHILLYAMMYEVHQSLFDKEPIDFSRAGLPPGYTRAIEIVNELGFKEIIAEYKTLA